MNLALLVLAPPQSAQPVVALRTAMGAVGTYDGHTCVRKQIGGCSEDEQKPGLHSGS